MPSLPVELKECSDADLLRLVAERDSAAMGALYDRHSRMLYATILRIAGEPAEAQDILHDAFVQIGRKAGGYDPAGGRPVGWLVTLARNLALDRVRVAKRRRELLETALEPDPRVVSGDAVVDQKDEAHYWANAVANLPSPQREALELAFFAGYTQEEISERLQQPLGTIKARIRRGLLKLRDSIEAAS
ncbi:MAG: sigma-70 family RNA polymerase sigma factor [Verrucomicrobiales bacterium]